MDGGANVRALCAGTASSHPDPPRAWDSRQRHWFDEFTDGVAATAWLRPGVIAEELSSPYQASRFIGSERYARGLCVAVVRMNGSERRSARATNPAPRAIPALLTRPAAGLQSGDSAGVDAGTNGRHRPRVLSALPALQQHSDW